MLIPIKPEDSILPLPNKFIETRDHLRVVRYELVRYTIEYARQVANEINHPEADYEYAIHMVREHDENGQVYLAKDGPGPYYSHEKRVLEYANSFIKDKSASSKTTCKNFFSNFGTLSTLLVPPYALALLGIANIEAYMERRDQEQIKKRLPYLLELPKFEVKVTF